MEVAAQTQQERRHEEAEHDRIVKAVRQELEPEQARSLRSRLSFGSVRRVRRVRGVV